MHLLGLWAFLPTKMTIFPTFFYTVFQQVQSLSFQIPKAWKRSPFRAEASRIGHYRDYPPPWCLTHTRRQQKHGYLPQNLFDRIRKKIILDSRCSEYHLSGSRWEGWQLRIGQIMHLCPCERCVKELLDCVSAEHLSERGLKSSRHSRYDYLIKYAYFVKCYLNRIASISDPKKWTSNVAQWKKHVNAISNNSWHQTVEAIPSCSILS